LVGYKLKFLGKDWVPIPLVFGKGAFETGVAARLLAQSAEDPCRILILSQNRK
jgi:hypothetical protein